MKLYVLIWLALLTLTGATVSISSVNLGSFGLAAALFIAVLKATLVALFFMHLWQQKAVYRVVLLTAALMVVVLIGFTVLDVRTRYPLAVPREAFTGVPDEPSPSAAPGSPFGR